jgi:hypothetical protein
MGRECVVLGEEKVVFPNLFFSVVSAFFAKIYTALGLAHQIAVPGCIGASALATRCHAPTLTLKKKLEFKGSTRGL